MKFQRKVEAGFPSGLALCCIDMAIQGEARLYRSGSRSLPPDTSPPNGRVRKSRGFSLRNKRRSHPEIDEVRARDEALLHILTINLQRIPGNDNGSSSAGLAMQDAPVLGPFARVKSAAAFVGVMMLGVVITAIFRVVPAHEDGGE